MTEDGERRRRTRLRLWLALAAVTLVLALAFVPPMLSIQRYKSRITQLVSASLGRPVRLSSVELRLLPRPGFVLSDLTVDEDPAYGVEPVLHAATVTASVRFSSLWRGHLAISRISVDEASLNLVRDSDGHWNLDPLFRTAAARSSSNSKGGRLPVLPYLEATNSRVNIKHGIEKLPYSLVNADLSFWQENPGDWRLRLRGQPARTDVNLDLADTGIVRVEASLRRAPELRLMPLHVEMEWREAQLGQLSRLVFGSDPGWRGDLTGQMQLDGTADAAQVKTRLRATGVHRAEFEPADALDFDANCSFVYHYSGQSVEHAACDSPLGDGRVQLSGELPSNAPMKFAVAVDRVPVSAALGALRTMRSGIPDDLESRGTISGQLTYDPAASPDPVQLRMPARHHPATGDQAATRGPLAGNLTIDGFTLTGSALKKPIQIAKIAFAPTATFPVSAQILSAAFSIPEDGPSPLAFNVSLGKDGFRATINGPAALPRLRELVQVAGFSNVTGLDAIAGDSAMLTLRAGGPWIKPQQSPTSIAPRQESASEAIELSPSPADSDFLDGTIAFHGANWKSAVLANPVQIPQATLQISPSSLNWDSVEFAYGPVRGTASLQIVLACPEGQSCVPQLDLHFDSLDTAELQAALLGARQPGTLLSSLIARVTPSSTPLWPRIDGTLKADTLTLAPITLKNASIAYRILAASVEITSIDASALGGSVHAAGTLTSGDKPSYALEATYIKLNAQAICDVLKMHCSGGPIDGSLKVALTGYSDRDLAASASGTLHFDWRKGVAQEAGIPDFPKSLSRFDHWSADAAIGQNAVTLGQNQVLQGTRKSSVNAVIHFGDPPQVSFSPPAVAAASLPARH